MLELDMTLDGDLGIDSIKRVEIFSVLREKLPDAPEIEAKHLGELETLQHIVDHLTQVSAPDRGSKRDDHEELGKSVSRGSACKETVKAASHASHISQVFRAMVSCEAIEPRLLHRGSRYPRPALSGSPGMRAGSVRPFRIGCTAWGMKRRSFPLKIRIGPSRPIFFPVW